MIQRPQTLFLLGSFFLSLLLISGPLAMLTTEAGEHILTFSHLQGPPENTADISVWPLSVLLVAVAVLSFLVIFLFRNRVRQMRFTVFLILLNVGCVAMIAFYTLFARNHLEARGTIFLWRSMIPLISPILYYLAFRRIRRDELLVKAYDRIR